MSQQARQNSFVANTNFDFPYNRQLSYITDPYKLGVFPTTVDQFTVINRKNTDNLGVSRRLKQHRIDYRRPHPYEIDNYNSEEPEFRDYQRQFGGIPNTTLAYPRDSYEPALHPRLRQQQQQRRVTLDVSADAFVFQTIRDMQVYYMPLTPDDDNFLVGSILRAGAGRDAIVNSLRALAERIVFYGALADSKIVLTADQREDQRNLPVIIDALLSERKNLFETGSVIPPSIAEDATRGETPDDPVFTRKDFRDNEMLEENKVSPLQTKLRSVVPGIGFRSTEDVNAAKAAYAEAEKELDAAAKKRNEGLVRKLPFDQQAKLDEEVNAAQRNKYRAAHRVAIVQTHVVTAPYTKYGNARKLLDDVERDRESVENLGKELLSELENNARIEALIAQEPQRTPTTAQLADLNASQTKIDDLQIREKAAAVLVQASRKRLADFITKTYVLPRQKFANIPTSELIKLKTTLPDLENDADFNRAVALTMHHINTTELKKMRVPNWPPELSRQREQEAKQAAQTMENLLARLPRNEQRLMKNFASEPTVYFVTTPRGAELNTTLSDFVDVSNKNITPELRKRLEAK